AELPCASSGAVQRPCPPRIPFAGSRPRGPAPPSPSETRAGVGDARTVSRWASSEVTEIRDIWMEQRLRTAYEIAQLLLTYDAVQTVKAWFIGLNPQLGDVSPAEALRDGRLKETLSAARAFTVGG